MESDFNAIDVARGALAGGDEGLLFLTEGVEKAGLTDVWAADESDFKGWA